MDKAEWHSETCGGSRELENSHAKRCGRFRFAPQCTILRPGRWNKTGTIGIKFVIKSIENIKKYILQP